MPRLRRRGVAAAGALALLTFPTPSFPQVTITDETEFKILQLEPMLGSEIAALQYVLTPAQMEELVGQGYEHAMREWIEEYWAQRDPIFTTKENEVRMEHERRIAYAAEAFRNFKWPGWDHRGAVYIRYGPPSARQTVEADVTAAGFLPPREYWWYGDHGVAVVFEDALDSGNYERILYSARGAGTQRLFKVNQPIDAAMVFGEGVIDMPPAFEDRFQPGDWINFLGKFDALIEKRPSAYPTDMVRERLPFYFAVNRFRGGPAIDRVDVNIEFVADLGRGRAGHTAKNYEATAVFWDTNGEEIRRHTQDVQLPTAAEGVDSLRMFPSQLRFSLFPDFYHMAVTVRETESGKFSSFRQDVRCPDFDSRLAVSDVVFASRIAEATTPSPFNRGPLVVVPHPFARYDRSAPIPVYFEVYNLATDARGVGSYTVQYEIVGKKVKQPGFFARLFGAKPSPVAVSASFEGTCLGPEDRVNIAVGPGNLWRGEFTFKVSIEDETSGARARSEAVFHIVD